MKEFFIKTALLISQRSKCVSKKVGSVITRDSRIISTGYNGSPQGFTNCNEKFSCESFDREAHHSWSNKYETHSELNAILFAAKNGIPLEGSEIFVTLHPCDQCIKNIMQSGIKKIYYLFDYDKFDKNNDMLNHLEIECILTPEIEEFIGANGLKKIR